MSASEAKQASTDIVLLETAISLIWQSSYHRVGVNEICQHAGVTKGSFYHHFDSKADLFRAASHYYWDSMKQTLDEIFSPTMHPLEQLEALILFAIAKQQTNPEAENEVSGCPFFSAGAQADEEEAAVREAVREMSGKCHQYNRALVLNLMAHECLNDKVDADQTARLIQQYVQGLFMYGRVYNSLQLVRSDIRTGLYRLLTLKEEYQHLDVAD